LYLGGTGFECWSVQATVCLFRRKQMEPPIRM